MYGVIVFDSVAPLMDVFLVLMELCTYCKTSWIFKSHEPCCHIFQSTFVEVAKQETTQEFIILHCTFIDWCLWFYFGNMLLPPCLNVFGAMLAYESLCGLFKFCYVFLWIFSIIMGFKNILHIQRRPNQPHPRVCMNGGY
jgi:hypothetical protein